MVVPLYDDNPFTLPVRPVVTWGLIAANILVYLMEVGTGTGDTQDWANIYGLLPSAFTGDVQIPDALAPVFTLVTYMFLHADFWHLFGNMIFLWVFGDDIEEALGRGRFLAFYLLCGIAGALLFIWSDPHAQVTLIGASGAIVSTLRTMAVFTGSWNRLGSTSIRTSWSIALVLVSSRWWRSRERS